MKKSSEHTKKVIRLFKWFLKVHGVADEYKKLLKEWNRFHGPHDGYYPPSVHLILKAFPFKDDKWGVLNTKWVEICHAFNL